MKNLSKIFVMLCLTFAIAGCTQDQNFYDNGSSLTSLDSIALENDPAESCNSLSSSKKILINTPCPNQTLSKTSITLRGKIVNLDEQVMVEVIQNGATVFSKEIFPVPTNAASEYKLINEQVAANVIISGQATLQISQSGDKLSIPVNF